MSMKDKYLEAMQRGDAKDAARAAKKARAQQPASSAPVEPQRSAVKAAQEEGMEIQPRKTCLCHKGQNRPMDSHGCCKAQIDSIRYPGRVAADTDLDDVARVQAIIDSGVIKRAKTKSELAAQREERGTAAALKDVANANNKPVAIVPKADLPEGVSFVDQNQAHHFAKCAVLRGLNFQLAARDAYPLLTPFEHSVVAAVAEKDANIRAAIEQEASQRGLGESDKKIFVGLLWRQALSTKPSEYIAQGNAMRILSKVFIEGQQQPQTPARLEISGIDEGLKKMFGSNFDKLKELQQPVMMPDISENDFDADEEGK